MTIQHAPMSLSDLQQNIPTQNRWENLETMYEECRSMFGCLLVYPEQTRELEPYATEEEKMHLQRILQNIRTDCEAYLKSLNEVHAQHLDEVGQPRKGVIFDTLTGDDLFQFTGIGAAYRNWMDSFQAITIQPSTDFANIAEAIRQRHMAKPAEATTVI